MSALLDSLLDPQRKAEADAADRSELFQMAAGIVNATAQLERTEWQRKVDAVARRAMCDPGTADLYLRGCGGDVNAAVRELWGQA